MLIAAEKIQKIKTDFDQVIQYSQNIEEPKTEKLFEDWYAAKEKFIKIFGDLIYEHPEKVSFELSPDAKHNRVMHFIDSVYNNWGYTELANFIELQEEGFFKNTTVADYTTWSGKTITKGTKLVKAFKHFIANEKSLTDIQNEASRIIQEDKIEGKLCLSVHPLDYLSISETTYNWRSCHSLDGEYRAGNLSYMMDNSTIVCYLKAENDTKLPHFPAEVPWNSKKWRVLLFMSSDEKMIFAGRQYPFSTPTGMNIILKEVLPQSKLIINSYLKSWVNWNKSIQPTVAISDTFEMELRQFYIPIGTTVKHIADFVKDKRGSKHFNDLLHSSSYVPEYTALIYNPTFGDPELLTDHNTKFEIGEYTYCLHCGEKEVFGGADTMRCEHCELQYGDENNDMFTFCDCCGNRVYTEDTVYLGNDVVCINCYDDFGLSCECCGESFYKEDMLYDEETEQWLCNYCYNELMEERENGTREYC